MEGLYLILAFSACGILYGIFNLFSVKSSYDHSNEALDKMHNSIANGAYTYISTEYKYLSWFLLIFGIFIYFTIDQYVTGKLLHMPWLTVAFLLGALASLAAGFTGISIAVMANIRVTISVCKSLEEGFLICFKSAASVAFLLLSIAVSTLASLVAVYKYFIIKDTTSSSNYLMLYDNIAGFALGAAMAALFGRVGGGIYTKAADIGADLTSTEHEMEEDDPKNPATIADIVGDNVGDVAGMGSELFACFAQSTCAVMLVAAAIPDISKNESILSLPLIIASLGIAVAIISTIFASYVMNIDHESDVERVLKYQLTICSILMTAAIYIGCDIYIPNKFVLGNGFEVTKNGVYACMIVGLWAGYTISYITEYCTSNANDPVKEVVKSCETGAATNIIYGVALGYGATVIPIVTIAFTIYTSYILGEMYGIAMSSVGMLSTVCISFTLNAFGPISDNAKGLMTVCKLDDVEGKERALTLVSAGNSMGASSMGFSLGVAALSALSMFGAVISRAKLNVVDILHPLEFAGLIIGAMIPYAFSALTLKSVLSAAKEIKNEVDSQLKKSESEPNYSNCILISTRASLKEMLYPGFLAIITPIIVGILLGPRAVCGILAGSIVSGCQMSISFSITGETWDNAKKLLEQMRGRSSHEKKERTISLNEEKLDAAKVGDAVGDPMKGISGPAINILITLMTTIALVFTSFFMRTAYLTKYMPKYALNTN